jgi:hypothetical protein
MVVDVRRPLLDPQRLGALHGLHLYRRTYDESSLVFIYIDVCVYIYICVCIYIYIFYIGLSVIGSALMIAYRGDYIG